MVQKIVQSGNPLLRKISRPIVKIDKKVLKLIQDLKDTLAVQKNPEGVGLAAPQIGVNLRVFYAKYKKFELLAINPKIISIKKVKAEVKNKNAEILEGCLSLPHYYGPLKRGEYLKIEYMNEKGQILEKEFKGFDAQIILHEIDHLDGILFVDRLLQQKKKLYKLTENDEWEEVEL
jgi:peptide deformylase